MTTFPRPLADFWNGLRVTSVRLSLPEIAQMTRTAGGETIVSSLGRRLWRATVQLAPETFSGGAMLQAQLRLMRSANASFLVSPLPGRVPAGDPLGSIAAASVTVLSVNADRTAVAITGLPPGYILKTGDFLSIDSGGIPHLHQIIDGSVAGAAGNTSEMTVVPPVRLSVIAGQNVTLVDPVMKAVCDPNGVEEGQHQQAQLRGATISFIQVLK